MIPLDLMNACERGFHLLAKPYDGGRGASCGWFACQSDDMNRPGLLPRRTAAIAFVTPPRRGSRPGSTRPHGTHKGHGSISTIYSSQMPTARWAMERRWGAGGSPRGAALARLGHEPPGREPRPMNLAKAGNP